MKRLFNFFKKQTDKNIDLNDSNYISNQESILSKLNNEKQKELLNNGFIKLKVLDTEKTNQLLNLYLSQPNARREDFGFHVSLDINQENIVNTIAQKISEIIQPNVDLFLNNYQFISPRFAVKEANQNSLVPPHQDWSFVDETEFQSYNLWIALTPTKLNNGTLGFLKGSHNKLKNIRATPLPIYKVPFHDYAFDLLDELKYIELEPGEAFLFNSRIIHASKPNISNDARINIASEITNKTAQLIHFNLQPDNKTIHEYFIDNNFFNLYSNAKLTEIFKSKKNTIEYKINRTFKYKQEYINKQELLA